MPNITGTFDVTLTPQTAPEALPCRYSIAKQFHGGLQGTSHGEMLVVMTVQGSGGYVALEQASCSTAVPRCAAERTCALPFYPTPEPANWRESPVQ